MNKPEVSIIVPVYNVEKYLPSCIDGILAQTQTNFELLLINDGSTDHSGKICDEYAKKDNRIKVFHKENGGVSSARNVGLDNASGEWITFVDADDFIKPDFILKLLDYRTFDHIVGGNIVFGERNENRGINKISIIKLKSHDAVKLDYGRDMTITNTFNTPWGKLFKTCIIKSNSLHFDTRLFYCEDLCFCLYYLSYCENVIYVPCNNYVHRLENSDKKYWMKGQDFITHTRILTEAINKLEQHTGCSLKNTHRNTALTIFYRYYIKLKNCAKYKEYAEQTYPIRKHCMEEIKYAMAQENIIKRIYFYSIIKHPHIGYFMIWLKKKLQ